MKKLIVHTCLWMALLGFWAWPAGAQVSTVISPIRVERWNGWNLWT